jgi:flagellar motor switch protein FliG
MLKKNEYLSMVKSFKENQIIYEDTERYTQVKIKNDDKSWKKVYNEIRKLAQDE